MRHVNNARDYDVDILTHLSLSLSLDYLYLSLALDCVTSYTFSSYTWNYHVELSL